MDAKSGSGWVINLEGSQGTDQLGRVSIAQPLPVGDDRLVFSGHVSNAGAGVAVNIRHGGELLASCTAMPGFVADVPARSGIYHIEMTIRREHDRDVICRWEVVDEERQDIALAGMVERSARSPNLSPSDPQALLGRMGQLFLTGDTNDSVGQFTRSASLSDASVKGWTDAFAKFPRWQEEFDLAQISLLIAPAKEEVLREYYPFRRAQATVFDDFLKRFADQPVIMPRWELWNRRQLSYSNTDTHWTDFGATVAAQTVLKRWGIAYDALPAQFTVEQKIGDLGIKLDPPVSSFELTFSENMAERLLFDNGVINQGCVRVYRHSSAPFPGKILIFGDSFGTNLAEAMSYIFQEVVYAYQPAGVDPELVDIVGPTHMLLQITQRFVHGAPATGHSIFESGRGKFGTFTDEEREQAIARLSAAPPEFKPLIMPLLG
jgi:hypothetical protein